MRYTKDSLDKYLVRESIVSRIAENKKDMERCDKNGTLISIYESKVMALESLLDSLDAGNFDWKGDK